MEYILQQNRIKREEIPFLPLRERIETDTKKKKDKKQKTADV